MFCKYCGSEIEENAQTCPNCGEVMDQAKKSDWRLPVLIIGCVILAAAIVVGSLYHFGVIGGGNIQATEPAERPTEPVETAPASEAPVNGEPDKVVCKDNYTVNDQLLQENLDRVVATFEGHQLDNRSLQIYYWMYVSNFLYNNRYNLSAMGLDFTKQFHGQQYTDELTWQQSFLMYAVDNWHRYSVLYSLALDAGYELDADMQKAIDDLPEQMQKSAAEGGYASVDEMLSKELGPACTMEGYRKFMTVYYVGLGYFSQLYDNCNPTLQQLEEYFTAHAEELQLKEITKDAGSLVDVRHILLEVEDTDKDGTVSDGEWEACRVEAQNLLDQWLAGEHTEDSFAQLANTHSEDPGSNTNGGLYQNVAKGDMLESFDAWIFGEGRQIGDHGLVKTKHGYHLMYFVGGEDIWIRQCREAMKEEAASGVLKEALDAAPITVNYANAMLGFMDMSQ